MRKKERYEKVIAWFQDNVPVAETELPVSYTHLVIAFQKIPGISVCGA